MLGYIRVVIDEKGKMVGYQPDSLYYPTPQTLDCLHEVFQEGFEFDFTDNFTNDTEALVAFKILSYPSNNPLDPIDYDFDLHSERIVVLRNGYKQFSREELERRTTELSRCNAVQEQIDALQSDMTEWENRYQEDFYPNRKPEHYVMDPLNTHDPFDIYLYGM